MRWLVATMAALAVAGCGSQSGDGASDKGAAAVQTAPPLKQLRIAIDAKTTQPCAQDGPDWPAEQRAYARHLADRMEVPVSLCPMATSAETAEALRAGTVDIGLLDHAAHLPVQETVRPILAERIPADLGRVIAVLVVPQASPLKSLAEADKVPLIISRQNDPVLGAVKRTIIDAGISDQTIAAATIFDDAPSAVAALQAGQGKAMILHAAEWFRYCRGEKKNPEPCKAYRTVWTGRSPVDQAWSARRDISLESWARLVGIHVALFDERPDIARWLAPRTTEIAPVEATALDPLQ